MIMKITYTAPSGVSWTDPYKFNTRGQALRHARRIKRPAGVKVAIRADEPCDHPSIDLDTLTCVKCGAAIPVSKASD